MYGGVFWVHGNIFVYLPFVVEFWMYFLYKWFHGYLNLRLLVSAVAFAESFSIRDPLSGGEVTGFGHIESMAES